MQSRILLLEDQVMLKLEPKLNLRYHAVQGKKEQKNTLLLFNFFHNWKIYMVLGHYHFFRAGSEKNLTELKIVLNFVMHCTQILCHI